MAKQFAYFEITDGGMEQFIASDIEDFKQVYGWQTDLCKEADDAMIEWVKKAQIGEMYDHRNGCVVRLKDTDMQGNDNIELTPAKLAELRQKAEVAADSPWIADLEAQQATEDKWKQARAVLFAWEIKNKVLNYEEKQLVLAYVRELQHQVAELDDELRCERIEGIKKEMQNNGKG